MSPRNQPPCQNQVVQPLGDDGNDKLNGGIGIDRINGVLTGLSKDMISDTTKIIDTSFAFDFDALLAGLL